MSNPSIALPNGLEGIINDATINAGNASAGNAKKGFLSKVGNFIKRVAKTEYDYFTKDLKENYTVNNEVVFSALSDIKQNYTNGIEAKDLALLVNKLDRTFSKRTAKEIFNTAQAMGYVKNPNVTFKEALRNALGKKEYFKENLLAAGRTYGKGIGMGLSLLSGGLGAAAVGLAPFAEYVVNDLGFLAAQSEIPHAVKRFAEKMAGKYDSKLMRKFADKADYYTSQALLGGFTTLGALSALGGSIWGGAQALRNVSSMYASNRAQKAQEAMNKGDKIAAEKYMKEAEKYAGISGLFMLGSGAAGAFSLDKSLADMNNMYSKSLSQKSADYAQASVLPKSLMDKAKDVALNITDKNRTKTFSKIDSLKTIELGDKTDVSKAVYDRVIDSHSNKAYTQNDFKGDLKIGAMSDRGNVKSSIIIDGDLYDIAKNNDIVVRFTDAKGKSRYIDLGQFKNNNNTLRFFGHKNVKHAEVYSIEDVNGDGVMDAKVKLASSDITDVLKANTSNATTSTTTTSTAPGIIKLGDKTYALDSKYARGLSIKEDGNNITVSTTNLFNDYNDKGNLVARIAWDTNGDNIVDKYADFKLGEKVDLSKLGFDKDGSWLAGIVDKNGVKYKGVETDGATFLASDRHNGAYVKGVLKSLTQNTTTPNATTSTTTTPTTTTPNATTSTTTTPTTTTPNATTSKTALDTSKVKTIYPLKDVYFTGNKEIVLNGDKYSRSDFQSDVDISKNSDGTYKVSLSGDLENINNSKTKLYLRTIKDGNITDTPFDRHSWFASFFTDPEVVLKEKPGYFEVIAKYDKDGDKIPDVIYHLTSSADTFIKPQPYAVKFDPSKITPSNANKYEIPIIDGKKVSWAHPDINDKTWDAGKFDNAKIGYTKDGNKYFNWESSLSYKFDGNKLKAWANKYIDGYNDKDNLVLRIGYDKDGNGTIDAVKDFSLSKDNVTKHKPITIDDLAGFNKDNAWYIGIIDKNGIDYPGVEKSTNPTYIASYANNGAKIPMSPSLANIKSMEVPAMEKYKAPNHIDKIPETAKQNDLNKTNVGEVALGLGLIAAIAAGLKYMKRDYSGSGHKNISISGGKAF